MIATAVLVLFGLIVFAYLSSGRQDVEIKGLAFVEAGMTTNQLLSLLGHAKRASNTVMRAGIYGVPDEIEATIGIGNRFEMWSYEQSSAAKSVYATVWLVPLSRDERDGLRVVDVTTQVVKRSISFRTLEAIDRAFPGLLSD